MHNIRTPRFLHCASAAALAALGLTATPRPAAAQQNYLQADVTDNHGDTFDQQIFQQGPTGAASASGNYAPYAGALNAPGTVSATAQTQFGEFKGYASYSRTGVNASLGIQSLGATQDYLTLTSSDPALTSGLVTFTLTANVQVPFEPAANNNLPSNDSVQGSVSIFDGRGFQNPVASVSLTQDAHGNITASGPVTVSLPAGDYLKIVSNYTVFAGGGFQGQPLSDAASADFRFYADSATPGLSLTPTASQGHGYGSGYNYSVLAAAPEPSPFAALGVGLLGLGGLALKGRKRRAA